LSPEPGDLASWLRDDVGRLRTQVNRLENLTARLDERVQSVHPAPCEALKTHLDGHVRVSGRFWGVALQIFSAVVVGAGTALLFVWRSLGSK